MRSKGGMAKLYDNKSLVTTRLTIYTPQMRIGARGWGEEGGEEEGGEEERMRGEEEGGVER